MSFTPENPDLSHLGTFADVKLELDISLGEHGLYRRNHDGRIVLFRGQQTNYPDALRASTDPETSDGEYGKGAYFGNSPAAVAYYVAHLDKGVQAYLLPEIDEGRIVRVSHHAARIHRNDETTNALQVFPVPFDTWMLRRITHKQGEGQGKQLWVRIPGSAKEIIDGTEKLARLGHIGIGQSRFRRR